MTEQVDFWQNAASYTAANDGFDDELCVTAWAKMLGSLSLKSLTSIAELGSNVGRNLKALSSLVPTAALTAYDVNLTALKLLQTRMPHVSIVNESIVNLAEVDKYDLVFTSGVLIHINPEELLTNLDRIYHAGKKYFLFAEYFSVAQENVFYKNRYDLLWKRDFGRTFLDNFAVKPVDHGFLWSRTFGPAGFDDLVWWLFEKD